MEINNNNISEHRERESSASHIGRFELDHIYNEDCYKAIKDIPDKSVDLIVTDPPYEWQKGGEMTGLFAKGVSSRKFMYQIEENNLDKGIRWEILDDFVRVLKKINIYIWCNKDQLYKYMEYFVGKKSCYFEIIVWNKTNVTPLCGNKYLTDKEYCLFFREKGVPIYGTYETKGTVYRTSANSLDKNRFNHPNCKPIKILKNIIINSTNENNIVLDCFMGSGSTAVACKETNRHYLGFEIDAKWCKVANNRLNNQDDTGQFSMFTF